MKKKWVTRLMKRMLPQILIQSLIIMFTAIAAYMFMAWFIDNVFHISDVYLSAVYGVAGALVIMTVILVIVNTVAYRARSREVMTLLAGIRKVADGDFSTRIAIRKWDPMIQVYEDFNKMSAELESVQMLRNDFINNYSHEFKTPIASINGFASLLMEKELSREEQIKYLRIIVDESARLSSLASRTILLSKLQAQQIVTDVEEYSLSEQLRQCSIILSKEWLDKKIDFSGTFSPVVFRGNKELMQHLWLNLLGNAIKYTPEGGKIEVGVLEERGEIRVSIRDTGEGMNRQTLDHIFDPYYQGDTSHAGKGLGLGLSIVKRILELCHGSIDVFSKPQKGSEFVVTLLKE